MSGFGKFNVLSEADARDLQKMLREYKVTNGFRRLPNLSPFEKLPDENDTTKIVVLLGRPKTDERISAVVLQTTDSIVYDVNLSGLYGVSGEEGEDQTFPLQVSKSGGSARIVDIPFQATAEEFHTACGFDNSVKVWLGAYLYSGGAISAAGSRTSYSDQRYPLFRWLVDVGDSGWGVSYVEPSVWLAMNGTGSPNINRIRLTGTDQFLTVSQPIPPFRFVSRSPVYADFSIDWDGDLDRWVVTLNEDPADGSVIAAVWDARNQSWTHGNVTSFLTWYYNVTTYPSEGGDPLFLMAQRGEGAEPGEEVPSQSDRRRVTWIYLNGVWNEIYTDLTVVQRGHLFSMWGYGYGWSGWGGWNSGWGLNGDITINSDGSGWSSPGCIALAHKSGAQWLLGNIENRAFSFVQV